MPSTIIAYAPVDVYVYGKNLADGVIKPDHARAYDSGERLSWCEQFMLTPMPVFDRKTRP